MVGRLGERYLSNLKNQPAQQRTQSITVTVVAVVAGGTGAHSEGVVVSQDAALVRLQTYTRSRTTQVKMLWF